MRVSVEEPVAQREMLGLLLCVREADGQCDTVAEVQDEPLADGDLLSVGDTLGVIVGV